jgi:TBC domain-containing protein kinase-like protein
MDSISYTLLEAFNNDTELATICLNELYKRRIVKLPSDDKIIDLSLYYGDKL